MKSTRSKVFLADASDRPGNIKKLFQEFDLATSGTMAVKANFNSDDAFPAATHLETLRAMMELMRTSGPGDIIMAERSGMGYTPNVLRNRGVVELSAKLGFKLVDLDSLGIEGWEDVQSESLHWKHGFKIARIFREADIMSGCIFEQEQISRAASLEVGVASSEGIDLVPLDPHSQKAAEVIRKVLDSQG